MGDGQLENRREALFMAFFGSPQLSTCPRCNSMNQRHTSLFIPGSPAPARKLCMDENVLSDLHTSMPDNKLKQFLNGNISLIMETFLA